MIKIFFNVFSTNAAKVEVNITKIFYNNVPYVKLLKVYLYVIGNSVCAISDIIAKKKQWGQGWQGHRQDEE